MEMMLIESRALEQIGYDKESSELRVVFKDGRSGTYMNVPEHIWDGLVNADSRGSYFNAYIKKGGYDFRYD